MAYPHERQIEYWTSRSIEEYFENLGYPVVVIPNSQRAEKRIPFDHLFANNRIKLFGLQYKRLYHSPDHWRLEQHQHDTLQRYPWIYYALSEVRSIGEHRNALHLTRIVQPTNIPWAESTARLQPNSLRGERAYARWGGFVQGLFHCYFGKVISNYNELRNELAPLADIDDLLINVYLITPDSQSLIVHRSPFIAELPSQDEGEFDIGPTIG